MENTKDYNACPTNQTNGSVMELPRIDEEKTSNHAVTIDKTDCTLMNQQKEFELIKSQLNELFSKLEERKEQQCEMSLKLDQMLELVSSIIINQNEFKINKTRDKSDIHNNQQFELQQDDERIVFDDENESTLLNIQDEEFESTITEVQNEEDEDIEVSFEIL